jgi:assimilatory nitrate reductase catalytic subunit
MNKILDKVKNIIVQKEGPLTRDMLLSPGKFGLGKVPERLKPDGIVSSICGYCATGCSLNIHLKENKVVNITPTTDYPVNMGMACPKGWQALDALKAEDRAVSPMYRGSNGHLKETTWEKALEIFVQRMKKVQQEHGRDSVAFLSTGQIPIEEMTYLGALAKFGMGMIHGDGNTRQCMATAAVAYKQSFGFDAPPYSYKDFEESDTIILVGSNLCLTHPIMWERICLNKNNPQIVVIDPRRTETAQAATHHYALNPASDLHLFYGLAHILIKNDWIDKKYIGRHVDGFSDFTVHVKKYDLDKTAEKTGLLPQTINELAALLHKGKKVSFWWTMGVNQSHQGVRIAQAIINLALITGNIGRPGTGANSITGQCNAMGSRMFSNTTSLFGGRDFTNSEHRHEVANILNIPQDLIPKQNSYAYDEIIHNIETGKIKALWIIATNSAHSWINQNDFYRLAEKLDFLVVQDMYYSTETAQIADLILPAAGWGEKNGTFINSERRLGTIKKVAAPPGQAMTDFDIFKLVARAWGCHLLFNTWSAPHDVFQVIKQISKGQPCDISGIRDYKMIDEAGGIQWPFTENNLHLNSERRLFEDGLFLTDNKKAKLIFENSREAAETPDEEYPFYLLTGRGTSSQWHTQTRTAKSKVLTKLYPETAYAEINISDAQRLKIEHNKWITVASRRGEITVRAFVTSLMKPGQVFIPMHYKITNQLTYPAFDPYSRQPAYKMAAVKLNAL